MFRYGHLIVISVLFWGQLSAQRWVQETRLLTKAVSRGDSITESGALGSKLFAYGRYDESRDGSKLFRLLKGKEALVFRTPLHEKIHDVQVSRDDSRIVFLTAGFTSSYPVIIFSVRPDGSQLTKLVVSGSNCEKFVWPGYGSDHCSSPSNPRLSPDGQKVLFFNEVDEWDEEAKDNLRHYYLSMVPVTGGPIVRLEEVGPGHDAVWSEDRASIYYYSDGARNDPRARVPQRYDLETGRSELLTDSSWRALRPLAVSQADGALYFRSLSKQGLTRLDPKTGYTEVVSKVWFDTFDLSPDGRWAVGLKDGDLTLVNLEFPSSAPLEMAPGVVDKLELGRSPAAREKKVSQIERSATSASVRKLLQPRVREALKSTGVRSIRWLDNNRLWCATETDQFRVGIIRLN